MSGRRRPRFPLPPIAPSSTLYNFMDGIDGLAGGEAAVASCFFFLVFAYYGESGWAATNLIITAASMGFLVHNWPPARIFMGDGGSAFLGAFYGMQSVVAALSTDVPFPVLVLPFANFILDTTFTLSRRMLGWEKWYVGLASMRSVSPDWGMFAGTSRFPRVRQR